MRQKIAADTGMLIRKPVSEVFGAFVDPQVTTQFWFTKSTGKLEKGKTVQWTWEMYNVTSQVLVKDLVQDRKLEIEWGSPGQPPMRVEWTFEPMGPHATFVGIVTDGFQGDEEAVLKSVIGNVGGFCWVLAGCKAYLEHHLQLRLIEDRFPKNKS